MHAAVEKAGEAKLGTNGVRNLSQPPRRLQRSDELLRRNAVEQPVWPGRKSLRMNALSIDVQQMDLRVAATIEFDRLADQVMPPLMADYDCAGSLNS
ncbi:MAG: hypothetical protein WA418_17555 [Bradyrhizobium sp.]